ncbi:alpha/beta fold hydrolase [Candidatus Gracilibacteria bacterium]|nr:alpha/beta fold hydrolase [Candidatus Gracilibacteria bacterium]
MKRFFPFVFGWSFVVLGCSRVSLETPAQLVDGAPPMEVSDYASEEILWQNEKLLLDTIQLPAGFHIEVFATNIQGARSLAQSDRGILYVGTRKEGKVYALEDRDQNGKVDRMDVITKGLKSPNGVAWKDGDLYVAEIDRILTFPNIDAQRGNAPEPEIISEAYPSDTHHGWKFIRFGPDGALYVPVGAPCNICESQDPIYASITRINSDGSGQEIVAEGIRNTVGFDWHPETKELWFTDNGRDLMGDNIPPDELNRISQEAEHFGYPYCHGKDISDPQFGKNKNCADFTPPAQELGPHVAALGMRFYTGDQFPQKYKNQIFLAEHGSWNRSTLIGYQVSLVTLEDNQARSYEPFATGWLEGKERWGRPVDVLVRPSGDLLVSDDYSGTVYRIWYEEEKKQPVSSPRGEESEYSFHSLMDQDFEGTDFTVGGLLEEYDTHKSYYATYRSNGLKISGTLHVPRGKGPFPVLVLNHGYFPPESYTNGYGFGREQKYFARHGYVVLHIDYRGYGYSDDDPSALGRQRWGYAGYTTDTINAILALQNANLPFTDMSRVGMFGHSLGGAVTLNAITAKPDLIDAAVIWGSSSGDYQKNFEQWSRRGLSAEAQEIFEEHFGSIDESESFRALSAQTYFDRIQTPISMHHGTADDDVPLEWSHSTRDILESLGKEVEYHEYPEAGHVFWGEYWDQAVENSREFFDEYLKIKYNQQN